MGPLLFARSAKVGFHRGMLLVKMKPRAAHVPSAPAAMAGAAFAMESIVASAAAIESAPSLLQALTPFERAGLIKRITPLARGRTSFAPHAPMAADSSAAAEAFGGALLATPMGRRSAVAMSASALRPTQRASELSSLIELQAGEDETTLLRALADDPAVDTVSRVPLRYLTLPRVPDRKATGSPRTRSPTVEQVASAPAMKARPARTAAAAKAAAAPPAAMWNLSKVRWQQARALSGYVEPESVKVAVLDTGIDAGHPDLAVQLQAYVHEYSALPDMPSENDIVGHGTHVAGTIAASIGNELGVNGMCRCALHAWKIFGDKAELFEYADGTAEFTYFVDPVMYLEALLDCADQGMDVLNLSIGGTEPPAPAESDAFAELLAAGTTVVAAMGNERESGSPTSYPAAIPGVIAVGATTLDDRVTDFSNRGPHIAITAPGDAIWSTVPTYPGQFGWFAVPRPDGTWVRGAPQHRETGYAAWPGTSMAAPHVAAAVAMCLGNGAARSPGALRKALIATADKVPHMQGRDFHPDFGHGRLNLESLLQRLLK